MIIQNKILLKQTALLFAVFALCFFLGILGDRPAFWLDYYIFYVFMFFILLFFAPISALYFLRIKKDTDLKGLNIAFKIFSWLLIATLLSFFIFSIFPEISFQLLPEFPGLGLWTRLHLLFSFTSLSSIFTVSIYWLPLLIVAGSLYYSLKINRKLGDIIK